MPAHNVSHVFIELGLVVVGLAVLARLANRWGFSAIPLYLLAGLAFDRGGLAPLELTENFIHIGGDIGVLLLLLRSESSRFFVVFHTFHVSAQVLVPFERVTILRR